MAGGADALGEVSEDAFLGGRLRLRQLRSGHRAGHDAMLLAAAVPTKDGERIADLGAGVGAAGLALAVRVPGVHVVLIEREAELARLAQDNIALNVLAGRAQCFEDDIAGLGLSGSSLAGSFDHVMMNPPYNDAGRHRASPDALRAAAHVGDAGGPDDWIETAARLLKRGGRLTLIWRADGLEHVLEALSPRFGALSVVPVYSRPSKPAIRVLVSGKHGAKAPLNILPALTLQDEAGRPSQAAEAILRHGAAIPAI